jgi:hypothetical protein
MRIWIRIKEATPNVADSRQFDADLNFHFDADPDPDFCGDPDADPHSNF